MCILIGGGLEVQPHIVTCSTDIFLILRGGAASSHTIPSHLSFRMHVKNREEMFRLRLLLLPTYNSPRSLCDSAGFVFVTPRGTLQLRPARWRFRWSRTLFFSHLHSLDISVACRELDFAQLGEEAQQGVCQQQSRAQCNIGVKNRWCFCLQHHLLRAGQRYKVVWFF